MKLKNGLNPIMNKLLLILILTLSFQSLTNADDISDFEIEGMSIGDSLLEFFNRNEILSTLKKQPLNGYIYPSKKYRSARFFSSKFGNYEHVIVSYRNKDKQFIIEHIMGVIEYKNNFSKCFIKINAVENAIDDFKSDFSKNKGTYYHAGDPTGKSEITQVGYEFANGPIILASCADWSKETNITDALRVEIQSKNFRIFVEETYN